MLHLLRCLFSEHGFCPIEAVLPVTTQRREVELVDHHDVKPMAVDGALGA